MKIRYEQIKWRGFGKCEMVFRFTEFMNFLKIFFYSQEKALYYAHETSVVAGNGGGFKGRRIVLSE